jgi:hypothetical protein
MSDATILDAVHRIGTRLLAWQQGTYYWGDAIAYDGMLDAAALLGNDWDDILAGRLRAWHTDALDSFDDALAPGQAAARLVAGDKLDPIVLERIVRAMTRLTRAEGVPLLRPQVPEWRNLVWVDSIYHVPSTLVSAGQVLDRPDLVEQGIDIASSTLAVLTTERSIGHAWDAGLRRSTGVEWTRGIGWALLGLLDVCELAPEASTEAGLRSGADRLLAALAASQRDNGMWPSVLGETDADDETSVAGFWLAAAMHPAAPAQDTELSRRALAGVLDRIDADGSVLGVSHDTHVRWSVADYLHPNTLPSPWGQGAALRGLVATQAIEVSR